MTDTELSIYRAAWGDHPLVAEIEAQTAQLDRVDGQLKAVAGELAALKRDAQQLSLAAARLSHGLTIIGYQTGPMPASPLQAVESAAEFLEGLAEWVRVQAR